MNAPRPGEGPALDPASLQRACRGVTELRGAALAAEEEFAAELEAVAPAMRESARNLVHYLAVRRVDVRALQEELARLGLSSLGRLESHVMASLDAVIAVLHALLGTSPQPGEARAATLTFDGGQALLGEHANRILGPAGAGHGTRIMVTMPGEAADDPALIRELVEGGMQVMRINCAHDDPQTWARMVEHLREAEHVTGRRCLLSFDLAGPKLRTGVLEPGPAVRKWRPERDAMGRVTKPARVRLDTDPAAGAAHDSVPVGRGFLAKARVRDRIVLSDARGRRRSLEVVAVDKGRCTCETQTTGYVVPGTRLELHRKGRILARGRVGRLPPLERWIVLKPGDTLVLLKGAAPGRDAVRDAEGKVLEPAILSCDLPEVFTGVRVDEPILFDDGRIRGTVTHVTGDRLQVSITAVAGGSAKLRAEKGINLPGSDLDLPALTGKDLEDLAAVAPEADMIAMSFVQRPEDIDALIAALPEERRRRVGLVLKIETQAAFNRLPALLLAAMRHPPLAVMVARGDLGVEVGFERLSEVQEEVLWLCEAAHVPVIWATQVLESLAKGGMPSRAEVTDAAMGGRAECVMLNKGPYIRETLRFLIDVLGRMEEHQHKKTSRLRKLKVSAAARARPRGTGAKPR